MCFKLIFCVLLCFLLCVCNGSPKGRDAGKYNTARYTDEENELMVQEVTKHIEKYKTIRSKDMWTKIAQKFLEKRTEKASGFSQERSINSLRKHFGNVLLSTHSWNEEKIPKELLEKLILLQETRLGRGSERVNSRSYTEEEDNLITDELLQPSCNNVFGISTLKQITAKFLEKHRSQARGFENERSFHAIRTHMVDMRRKGQFSSEIVKKFVVFEEGTNRRGSSSRSKNNKHLLDEEIFEEPPPPNTATEAMVVTLLNNENAMQMIDELLNTNVDVDFTKIQEEDDK